MKTLTKYLNEKLVVNKNYKTPYTCNPKSCKELRNIIEDRYNKLGPGTKQNPIDFNDVDISNISSFYNENMGIFGEMDFKYIDISDWDVSNVKNMFAAFCDCYYLKSAGDLSNWNVSNAKDMGAMFGNCEQLVSIGDLTDWNVSNVENMNSMFEYCKKLKSIGELSKWDVSNVNDMSYMFDNSGITNIPDWYKK